MSDYFREAFGREPGDISPAMTLRDYFAAKAMQGLLANPGGPIQRNEQSAWALTNCTLDDVAELAHELADAMLAARKR